VSDGKRRRPERRCGRVVADRCAPDQPRRDAGADPRQGRQRFPLGPGRGSGNGDIGFIAAIDTEEAEITVRFDGREVACGVGDLDALVPAYAATIHKAQGSEHPAVVILVLTQHYATLQRNPLYTGITRGKRLVVLVGCRKAVAIAVRNVSGRRRWSKLREWLAASPVGEVVL
jgi:hypothetical protein